MKVNIVNFKFDSILFIGWNLSEERGLNVDVRMKRRFLKFLEHLQQLRLSLFDLLIVDSIF